jgi:acyl-CoA synthetase (AMP-forming)/AMP-acid ligase II
VRTRELAHYVDAAGRPVSIEDEDGWFYPGDVGRLETGGTLFITGRSSEVINRGGVIVAPEAIEDVLRLDRRIRDVAVLGVPNASGIEEIWAAVVSDTLIDGRQLIEAARPRLNEKVPDRIVQVSEIPRVENAKISRHQLREQLRARVHGAV